MWGSGGGTLSQTEGMRLWCQDMGEANPPAPAQG